MHLHCAQNLTLTPLSLVYFLFEKDFLLQLKIFKNFIINEFRVQLAKYRK